MIERKAYEKCELEDVSASPEDILSGSYDDEIRARCLVVIEKEAPIKESLLCKRVLNSLGLYKLGSRLEPYFSAIITAENYPFTDDGEDERVFLNGKEEANFRYSDSDLRYSYQIPVREAMLAILYSMEEGKTYYRKKLIELFKAALGYDRKGSQVQILFDKALKKALSEGKAIETGNHRIYLAK